MVRRYLLLIFSLALIGTLAWVAWYVLGGGHQRGPAGTSGGTSSASALDQAFFLSSDNGMTSLSRIVGGKQQSWQTGQGAFVQSAAYRDDSVAEIEFLNNGQSAIRMDGVIMYASELPKLAVALSPDKKHIAYMEATEESAAAVAKATGKDQEVPLDWQIILFDTETDTQTTLGTGMYPLFVDDSNIIWFSPQGVRAFDMAADTAKTIDATASSSLAAYPAQSPDGQMVAWADSASKTVSVRRINGNALDTVATIQTQGPYIALGNDALYNLVSNGKGGTDVLKYDLSGGDPTKVYHFDGTVIRLWL